MSVLSDIEENSKTELNKTMEEYNQASPMNKKATSKADVRLFAMKGLINFVQNNFNVEDDDNKQIRFYFNLLKDNN